MRAAQQQRVGLGVRDDAAGSGDDGRLVLGDHALQRAALVPAEGRRAGHLDQIGNAGAVILLDAPIELDEGPTEMLRQHPAERRLAGAAQADERNAPGAVGTARAAQRAPQSPWQAPAIRSPALAPANRGWRRAPRCGRPFPAGVPKPEDRAPAQWRAIRSLTDCRRRSRSAPDSAPRSPRLGPIAGASCRAWRGSSVLRARSQRGMRLRLRLRCAKQKPVLQGAWSLTVGLATGQMLMHYNSCAIMHTRPRIGKLRRLGQPRCSNIFHQPRLLRSRAAVRFPQRRPGPDHPAHARAVSRLLASAGRARCRVAAAHRRARP